MNFGFEFTILKFPCTTLILVYMVVIFYKHWVWICMEGIIGNVFVTRPGVSDSFNFWNIKLKYIKKFTMYLPPYKHSYVHIFASSIDSISKKLSVFLWERTVRLSLPGSSHFHMNRTLFKHLSKTRRSKKADNFILHSDLLLMFFSITIQTYLIWFHLNFPRTRNWGKHRHNFLNIFIDLYLESSHFLNLWETRRV